MAHVGNDSILHPDGLAFDKLSGKRTEDSSVDENGIRRSATGNAPGVYRYFIRLFHIHRITEYGMGVKLRRGVRKVLGNFLSRPPSQKVSRNPDTSREVSG
jgi:hypothetical protein